MKIKKENNFTKVLFAVYFILLIWIILFKFSFKLEIGNYRNINLIPFSESVIINGKLSLDEIIYNVLIFMPFGIYISMVKPEWTFIRKIKPVFFTSLAVEILQYILAIGATDITDLIGNTAGGIIGIGASYLIRKVLKEKTHKVINVAACIVTVMMVSLFALIII